MTAETDPNVVLKAVEQTIKAIGKDIRTTKGGADKVNRLSSLINSYTKLLALMTEENKPMNYYEQMESEARRSIGR